MLDPALRPRHLRLAAYAVIVSDERILLCRLSPAVPRWQGHWTLPGGGVEFGEHPEAAMIREVAEETGLAVTADGIIGIDSILDCGGPDDRHGVRILFRARVTGGTLRSETDGTTDSCAWHRLDELAALSIVPLVTVALGLTQR